MHTGKTRPKASARAGGRSNNSGAGRRAMTGQRIKSSGAKRGLMSKSGRASVSKRGGLMGQAKGARGGGVSVGGFAPKRGKPAGRTSVGGKRGGALRKMFSKASSQASSRRSAAKPAAKRGGSARSRTSRAPRSRGAYTR